jgi:hypothetical protein
LETQLQAYGQPLWHTVGWVWGLHASIKSTHYASDSLASGRAADATRFDKVADKERFYDPPTCRPHPCKKKSHWESLIYVT